jgi:hypothetical protein
MNTEVDLDMDVYMDLEMELEMDLEMDMDMDTDADAEMDTNNHRLGFRTLLKVIAVIRTLTLCILISELPISGSVPNKHRGCRTE